MSKGARIRAARPEDYFEKKKKRRDALGHTTANPYAFVAKKHREPNRSKYDGKGVAA